MMDAAHNLSELFFYCFRTSKSLGLIASDFNFVGVIPCRIMLKPTQEISDFANFFSANLLLDFILLNFVISRAFVFRGMVLIFFVQTSTWRSWSFFIEVFFSMFFGMWQVYLLIR